jgi:hypothetical protein
MNRVRNTWPHPAPSMLEEKIKIIFETELKSKCRRVNICASCSVRYTNDEFLTVPSADLDLELLEKPDNWPEMPNHLTDIGSLANYILDSRGVKGQSDESPELVLCTDCYHTLDWKRLPKYAIANSLAFGEVPDVLQGLSPVEESMIALCRSKCIMVQLKTV